MKGNKFFVGAIVVLCFIASGSTRAQDTIRLPETINQKKINQKTAKVATAHKDDLLIHKTKAFSSERDSVLWNSKKLMIKDSLKRHILKDDPQLALLDSVWEQALYSTSLYDTIYQDVTTLSYEPVEFVDLPTDTLKARLERLDARTPFRISYNPSLENVIKNYLKNRSQHLERLIGLSDFYFPLFEQELDNFDIPLEVKYLAIVESALKPRAKSRVGATGLWQFMFGTGKMYGLDVSSYVDERMDPIKSTKAAAKYLAKLYSMFGDWDLALASYNSGPGNVTKAIRRSGGYRNYWNIRNHLPRETAGYLPAFLATMYIFEYAEEHGLKPHRPKYTYVQTDTVRVKQMIKLEQISELIDVEMEELQYLNPSYKLDIIPFIPKENYTLRLPLDKVGQFVNSEKEIYSFVKAEFDKEEKPLPKLLHAESKTRYRVKSGDYLGKIARKFGVRVSQIKRWNGLRSNNLKIGQRLTIYPQNPNGVTASKKVVSSAKSPIKPIHYGNSKTYIVRSGDTLWSISKKFSAISIQNIRDWNNISGNALKPGMKLKVSK